MAREEVGAVNTEWAELATHMENLLQQNLVSISRISGTNKFYP